MPINMQVEYPKLQAENIRLKTVNDSLVNAMKEANDELACSKERNSSIIFAKLILMNAISQSEQQ